MLSEDVRSDTEALGTVTFCTPQGIPRGTSACRILAHRHRLIPHARIDRQETPVFRRRDDGIGLRHAVLQNRVY